MPYESLRSFWLRPAAALSFIRMSPWLFFGAGTVPRMDWANGRQASIGVDAFTQSESFHAKNSVSENAGACGLPLNDLLRREPWDFFFTVFGESPASSFALVNERRSASLISRRS